MSSNSESDNFRRKANRSRFALAVAIGLEKHIPSMKGHSQLVRCVSHVRPASGANVNAAERQSMMPSAGGATADAPSAMQLRNVFLSFQRTSCYDQLICILLFRIAVKRFPLIVNTV